jgi:sRNA-binding protein
MLGPITAKRRKRKHEQALALLAIIQKTFPLAFPPKNTTTVYPLQPDITKDLMRSLSVRGILAREDDVQGALNYWCSQKFYLKSFETQSHYVDLTGFETSPVTAEEREAALAQKRELVRRRKAA